MRYSPVSSELSAGKWRRPRGGKAVDRRRESGAGLAAERRGARDAQGGTVWRRQGGGSAVRNWRQAGCGKAGCPRREIGDGLAAAKRSIGGAQVAAGWWRAGQESATG